MNQGDQLHLAPHLREVARMLADRKFNPEIARELSVTRHTVEKCVSELKQVLGASDRAELAEMCENLGSFLP